MYLLIDEVRLQLPRSTRKRAIPMRARIRVANLSRMPNSLRQITTGRGTLPSSMAKIRFLDSYKEWKKNLEFQSICSPSFLFPSKIEGAR
jgi:hypothetical protein